MTRLRHLVPLSLAGLLLAPALLPAGEPDAAALSKRIDDAVAARLRSDKVPPAGRADDARLLRRLYLDLLGRIPTVAEAEAFLADPAADRVDRLTDRLLRHPEMPAYWRRVIDAWLNGTDRATRGPGHDEFLAYLERSLAADKPWDRLVRELLLPSPTEADQRGASYFLASRLRGEKADQLDNLTTGVASGLFGVQLQCAKCHDHPFVAAWKQDHYYGLGAFFVRLESKNEGGRSVLSERPTGEVKFLTDKKVEKTADALFLDGVVLDPAGKDSKPNRRQKLADHALRPGSPYVNQAVVNRVWKQLLGVGLVEPVDQIHAGNPASHPDLLVALADDFAERGFDLRRLMAAILHSETYRRDSRHPAAPRPEDHLLAAAVLKPLSGEQMAWSLAIATGYTDQLAGKFARDLQPAPARGEVTAALRLRWERDQEFEPVAEKFRVPGESFQASAGQALFATFSPFARKLLQPLPGSLVQRLADEKVGTAAARLAFLAVLSRPPRPEEAQDVAAYLDAATDRKQAAADVVWALLGSAEFRFNH